MLERMTALETVLGPMYSMSISRTMGPFSEGLTACVSGAPTTFLARPVGPTCGVTVWSGVAAWLWSGVAAWPWSGAAGVAGWAGAFASGELLDWEKAPWEGR